MSHSAVQNRKKAEAMQESQHHMKHGSVIHPRGGMDHEDHKMKQMGSDMQDSQQPMGVNMPPQGNGGGSM